MTRPSVDARLVKLARRRYGVVTDAEIRGERIGRSSVARRLRDGRLVRVHAGVYRLGGTEHPLARYAAALVAIGPGAVLSHQTAGHLQALCGAPPVIHISVVGRNPGNRPGIRVHRVRAIEDRRTVRRLPVTGPVRTLCDIAANRRLRDDVVEQMLERALAAELVTPAQLQAAGRGRVARLATEMPGFTRSVAEKKMQRLIRAAELPEPGFNIRVARWEVDVAWPDLMVCCEVNSYRFHKGKSRFETDHEKRAWLERRGWVVVSITASMLVRKPYVVVALVAEALARGRMLRRASTHALAEESVVA